MKTDEELLDEIEEERRHPVLQFLRNWGYTILIVVALLIAWRSQACSDGLCV